MFQFQIFFENFIKHLLDFVDLIVNQKQPAENEDGDDDQEWETVLLETHLNEEFEQLIES